MERKTKVDAGNGKHDIVVTRDFELPVELLFKAYAEKDLFEQWMDTKVTKFEAGTHGCYSFETSDPSGNVVFKANGTFHHFIQNQNITRTFEMENTPFAVQLEFLDFEKLTDDTSRLTMHIIYKTAELRDNMLKMPFAFGLNMAHNRIEELMNKLK